MRWVIGILLVVNLLVLLWQGFISPPQTAGGQPLPPPDIGNLRLISERGGGDAPPAAPSTASPPQNAGSPTAPASETGALPERDVFAPAVEPVEVMAERPVDPAAAPSPGAQMPDSPVQEPGPAAQVADDKPLRPEKTPPAVPATSAAAKPRPAVAERLPCWDVGNFAERAQAQAIASELPPGLDQLDVVSGELAQVIGYYVLVPAAQDRDIARAMEARLKEKGFRDTWRFRSGPLENAISLGLFNRQRNAAQHAARVRGEGFDVVLREKTRPVPVFRLRVQGGDTQINRKIMKRLGAGSFEQVECP